jgi:hypothetical protein
MSACGQLTLSPRWVWPASWAHSGQHRFRLASLILDRIGPPREMVRHVAIEQAGDELRYGSVATMSGNQDPLEQSVVEIDRAAPYFLPGRFLGNPPALGCWLAVDLVGALDQLDLTMRRSLQNARQS